jgi:hypothetical protein
MGTQKSLAEAVLRSETWETIRGYSPAKDKKTIVLSSHFCSSCVFNSTTRYRNREEILAANKPVITRAYIY